MKQKYIKIAVVIGIILLVGVVVAVATQTDLFGGKSADTDGGGSGSTHQFPSDVMTEFNSNLFKLTLPIDKDGGDSSGASGLATRNIDTWNIVGIFLNEFEVKPYFFAENDEVVFRAHCAGATTPGTYYPRCEMRQRVGNGDHAWLCKDPQRMECYVRFTEVPLHKPEISVIQIHADPDEGGGQPLAVLYRGGVGVYMLYNEDYDTTQNPLPYVLGEDLHILVTVDNMIITCLIENLSTGASTNIQFTSAYESGYFKLGVYTLATIFQNEYKGGDAVDELPTAAGEVRVKSVTFEETYNRDDPDHGTLTLPPSVIPPGLISLE
jgi:hypothetical protein